MADRERKRVERRKRKERGSERRAQLERRRAEMAARSEERNQAARDALDPLEPDERPGVVTVGAIISALVSLSIVIGKAVGVEVSGDEPNALQTAAPAIIFAVMAWGMWRARYWAVLGFQTVLLLAILVTSASLFLASDWRQGIGNVALIAGCGALFYLNIKAMARIQMPESRHRGP